MGERWRDVVGFDRYEVSDTGKVKNKRTGRLLTGTTNADGYRQVRLRPPEGQTKTRLVHRLVAIAHLGPPPPGYVCNHKDGSKLNNTASNLEWCSRAENAAHAARLGLLRGPRGERNAKAKLTAARVVEMRRLSRSGVSCAALAVRFKVSPSTAYKTVVGQTWKHVVDDPPAHAVTRRGECPADLGRHSSSKRRLSNFPA